MKVFRVHLPKFDNDGNAHAWVHDTFQRNAATLCGGLTSWEARGVWYDDEGVKYDEPVVCYEIAYGSDEHGDKLYRLAHDAAARMGQKALYYVRDGVAEIVDLD